LFSAEVTQVRAAPGDYIEGSYERWRRRGLPNVGGAKQPDWHPPHSGPQRWVKKLPEPAIETMPKGAKRARSRGNAGGDYLQYVAGFDGSDETLTSVDFSRPESAQPWTRLAPDYERARNRDDSLDRLVEWPAQRELLGDITGRSVLDLGCGNGGKLAELVRGGASPSVGVDVSGNFLTARPSGLELVQGDLSELDSIPALAGRQFDRIMFLQSFGYASDPVRTLRVARALLAVDGFILLTRTQPIRYALERAERNGTSLGEEYFSTGMYSYRSGWNDQITLTKRPYTMSDLLNVFSAAGLWIETTVEPQLSEDARSRYPHKRAWMDKYLGILIFKLRPLPDHQGPDTS
jgi:SAM-dependent methyltransferase